MNCMRCGAEMNSTTNGNYACPKCGIVVNDLEYRPQNCGSKKGEHNMKGFIEVLNEDNNRVLININYIEEVIEEKNNCTIYLNFNSPNSNSFDFEYIKEPYESIKSKIEEAMK